MGLRYTMKGSVPEEERDCHSSLEQVMGIEPTSSAWKADALTVVLHLQMVVLQGLEPRTYRL